jgi:hypothetical protein
MKMSEISNSLSHHKVSIEILLNLACMCIFLGGYLYSGGEESVLVFWQVDTNHKQFKPRLGAPIAHICNNQDDTVIAVCHTDNGKDPRLSSLFVSPS